MIAKRSIRNKNKKYIEIVDATHHEYLKIRRKKYIESKAHTHICI